VKWREFRSFSPFSSDSSVWFYPVDLFARHFIRQPEGDCIFPALYTQAKGQPRKAFDDVRRA
jgi:hypothetical protein